MTMFVNKLRAVAAGFMAAVLLGGLTVRAAGREATALGQERPVEV
jgi:hypothetical protein